MPDPVTPAVLSRQSLARQLARHLAALPQAYLLAWDGPDLPGSLGTGTTIERCHPSPAGLIAVLATPQDYAPWQRQWLAAAGFLADTRLFAQLDQALAAALALNPIEETP
ncbi:MAG: hypothetical protein KKB13_19680 [Chloroflexi bacterium]|nr:hypothetical protein [Chloroflexota bacterium]